LVGQIDTSYLLKTCFVCFIAETAGLLAAKYFKDRYKPDWDVRQNLFEHQKINQKQKLSSHNDIWSNQLIEDMFEEGYQADQPYLSHTSSIVPPDDTEE
jgi:hypothetical protein